MRSNGSHFSIPFTTPLGQRVPVSFIEMGAIITGAVLVILVRKRRPAFYLTLVGAILLTVAFFLVWMPFISPVNAETAKWTVDSIPGNWMELRRQWEYAHRARFVLQVIGLGALLLSVLVETPTDSKSA
jgi:Domain of unknown function (DUF1772)